VNDQAWAIPADQQVTYALNAKTQADGWRESAEEHKADAVEARGDADAALETYPTPPAPDAATHAYGEGSAGVCQGDSLVSGGDDAYAEGEAELADARGLERPGSYEACFRAAAARPGLLPGGGGRVRPGRRRLPGRGRAVPHLRLGPRRGRGGLTCRSTSPAASVRSAGTSGANSRRGNRSGKLARLRST
jgi:hypothetical protein